MDNRELVLPVPVKDVIPNPYQPREIFDQQKLQELANSIEKNSLIQPIVVQPVNKDGKYELIAGERRLRAFQLLKRTEIPAVVKSVTPEEAQDLALIENLQRADLTLIEEGRCFKSLQTRYGDVAEIGKKVGKSASYVLDRISLLELCKSVRDLVEEGKLNVAQCKVLLEVKESSTQYNAATMAIKLNLGANQLKGRLQRQTKKGNASSSGNGPKVTFVQLSTVAVKFFEALQGFDPNLLGDEGKRGTLKKQLELIKSSVSRTALELEKPAPLQESKKSEKKRASNN